MRLVATLALAALLAPAVEAHAAVAGPAFDTVRIAVDPLGNPLDRGDSRSGLFPSENFSYEVLGQGDASGQTLTHRLTVVR